MLKLLNNKWTTFTQRATIGEALCTYGKQLQHLFYPDNVQGQTRMTKVAIYLRIFYS